MQYASLVRFPLAIAALLVLTACDKSPDPYDGKGESVVQGPVDTGLLADPKDYQPAKIPGAVTPGLDGSGSGAPTAATPDTSNADTQVRGAVLDLVGFVRDQEVENALRLFNEEQAKALLDNDAFDPLFGTFELVDQLTRQLDKSKVDALLGGLRGAGATQPTWDLLDAEHASVKPNIGKVLFGPATTGDAMVVAKQEGVWRFQLDKPLTAEDVAAIVAYHQKLQEQLTKLIDYVSSVDQVDEAVVTAAATAALNGEEVQLPTASAPSEKPAEEPGTTDTGEPASAPAPEPSGDPNETP